MSSRTRLFLSRRSGIDPLRRKSPRDAGTAGSEAVREALEGRFVEFHYLVVEGLQHQRVLVSSGRKFFAKNDATAILPS